MTTYAKKQTLSLSILFTLFWGIFTQITAGQENIIDSLENKLSTVSDTARINYLIKLSGLYFETSLKTSADYADSALIESKKINYKKGEADALNKTGNIHWITSNFEAAMENYLESLSIREKIKDSAGIAGSYNNLGIIASEFNDYDIAIEYTEKSYDINNKINSTGGIITNYNNLGTYYHEMEKYSKALNYYFMNLNLLEKIDDKTSLSYTLNNIGEIYNEKGKYEESLPYYHRALNIQQQIKLSSAMAVSKLNLGDVYLKTGDLENAGKFLFECQKTSKKNGYLDVLSDCYDLLSKYYEKKNNFSKALTFSKLFSATRDSIYSEETSNRFAEMQVSFESEMKDKEIELMRENEELRTFSLTKKKNRIVYLSVLLFLILFLVIFLVRSYFLRKKNLQLLKKKNIDLFYSSRKLKKSEEMLKETNESMDRFFSIIAHDLINPFHALLTLAEVLNSQNEELEKEEIIKYTQLINTSAKNLYNLLYNLLQWTKTQTGKLDNKPEYLDAGDIVKSVTDLLNINAKEKQVNIIISVDKNHKVFCDENLLLTILRNLISNAIKYSKKGGEIDISTTFKNGFVEFSVMDNGIGIPKENISNLFNIKNTFSTKGTNNETGTGLGLILCKEFVEIMGGKIWAESKQGKGTTFKFTIPNKDV